MTTNKAAEALLPSAERWARMFHDAYELAAPLFGYETREASRKPWEQVPENNRALMTAVAGHVGALIVAEATAQQAAEFARLREAVTEAQGWLERSDSEQNVHQFRHGMLLLRAALAAAAATRPRRVERVSLIRAQQAAGGGPVTGVMVSRAAETPEPAP